MNILFVANDKKGSGFYRMMVPANEIRKADQASVRLCHTVNSNDVQWAQIVILQRAYHSSIFEMVDWAKSIGKIIVYEIDDYLQGIDPSNKAYDVWSSSGPNLHRALALMQKCHAMTVTTRRLQLEYAPWNKNIHVLPNFLDRTLFTKTPTKFKDKWIRIGYVGAATHQDDLELIDTVMTRICKKFPNVRLKIMGIDPERAFKHIPKVDYKCAGCKRNGQMEVVKGCDITNYFNKLLDQGFDIGIAPLVDNSFNACKSDLKLKEYAALGIPVVASDVWPYTHSLQHGKTGYLARTAQDWEKYLTKLIEDKKLRDKMGDTNRKWMDSHGWIQNNVGLWVQTYEKIIQNVLKSLGLTPN